MILCLYSSYVRKSLSCKHYIIYHFLVYYIICNWFFLLYLHYLFLFILWVSCSCELTSLRILSSGLTSSLTAAWPGWTLSPPHLLHSRFGDVSTNKLEIIIYSFHTRRSQEWGTSATRVTNATRSGSDGERDRYRWWMVGWVGRGLVTVSLFTVSFPLSFTTFHSEGNEHRERPYGVKGGDTGVSRVASFHSHFIHFTPVSPGVPYSLRSSFLTVVTEPRREWSNEWYGDASCPCRSPSLFSSDPTLREGISGERHTIIRQEATYGHVIFCTA